jgi:hypothetical protein
VGDGPLESSENLRRRLVSLQTGRRDRPDGRLFRGLVALDTSQRRQRPECRSLLVPVRCRKCDERRWRSEASGSRALAHPRWALMDATMKLDTSCGCHWSLRSQGAGEQGYSTCSRRAMSSRFGGQPERSGCAIQRRLTRTQPILDPLTAKQNTSTSASASRRPAAGCYCTLLSYCTSKAAPLNARTRDQPCNRLIGSRIAFDLPTCAHDAADWRSSVVSLTGGASKHGHGDAAPAVTRPEVVFQPLHRLT